MTVDEQRESQMGFSRKGSMYVHEDQEDEIFTLDERTPSLKGARSNLLAGMIKTSSELPQPKQRSFNRMPTTEEKNNRGMFSDDDV
jgi:hypothetical protein